MTRCVYFGGLLNNISAPGMGRVSPKSSSFPELGCIFCRKPWDKPKPEIPVFAHPYSHSISPSLLIQ